MIAVRLGIFLFFLALVLVDDLRDMTAWVVPVLVAGLVFVIVQSDEGQTARLRRQAIIDLGTMVVTIPVLVLGGFVSAESGDLLPAEQSAMFQIAGASLIVLALMIWLAVTLYPDERSMVPVAILPGLIVVVSLYFVLHDYRNQTVVAMLAVSYFIGAAALALGTIVEEPVRRHIPGMFFVATILAGLILFDPGLSNVLDRDALIQVFAVMMILIGLSALFIIPNPSFDEIRLGASGTRERRRRRIEERVDDNVEGETNDFRGDASDRS